MRYRPVAASPGRRPVATHGLSFDIASPGQTSPKDNIPLVRLGRTRHACRVTSILALNKAPRLKAAIRHAFYKMPPNAVALAKVPSSLPNRRKQRLKRAASRLLINRGQDTSFASLGALIGPNRPQLTCCVLRSKTYTNAALDVSLPS